MADENHPSHRALTAIAATVFGMPVLLLCLLVPALSGQSALLQVSLIGLTLLGCWLLARWLAPVLERQVGSGACAPPVG